MLAPIHKKKTDEIISDLKEIFNSGLYNDFTLKKCKIEAKKLKEKKLLLEEVYTILGMIACIEGNIDEMHSYHRSALAYSGNSFFSLSNYAASLMHSFLYQEAYTYALKAFDIDKNEKIISMIIHTTYFLDKKDEFSEYVQFYKELYKKEHDIFSTVYISMKNVAIPMTYSEKHEKVLANIEKCTEGIVECFGYPIIIELEIMSPVDGVDEQWIAWIMSAERVEIGLDKMDMFHDWCSDNKILDEIENFNFNIDFLGNNEF